MESYYTVFSIREVGSLIIFFYIILITGAFFSGKRDKPERQLEFLFNSFVKGLIIIIVLLALFITRFQTIFLLGFLLIILNFKSFLPNKNKLALLRRNWKSLLIFSLFVIPILYFFDSYYYIIQNKGGVYGDHLFYANVAKSVLSKGIESFSFGSINIHPKPYHYINSYLAIIGHLLGGIKFPLTIANFVFPVYSIGVLLGGAALLEIVLIKQTNVKIVFLFVLFILFARAVSLPLIPVEIKHSWAFIDNPKLGIIFILIIYSTIAFWQKKYIEAIFGFLLLPVFYSTTIFPVYFGFSALIIFLLIRNGIKDKLALKIFGWLLFSSLIITFLYFDFSVSNSINSISFSEEINYREIISVAVFDIAKKIIRYTIICLPLFFIVVLIFKFNKKEVNRIENLSSLVLVSGIFLGGILFSAFSQTFMFNSSQPLHNFMFPLIGVGCYLLFLFVIKKWADILLIWRVLFIAFFSLIILYNPLKSSSTRPYIIKNIVNNFDNNFYKKLPGFIEDEGSFCFIKTFDSLSLSPHYIAQLAYPLSRISLLRDDYLPACISIPTSFANNSDGSIALRHVKKWPFYRYCIEYCDSSENCDTCEIDFIKETNSKFLIIESGCDIPNYFYSFVNDSLVRNDGLIIYKMKLN